MNDSDFFFFFCSCSCRLGTELCEFHALLELVLPLQRNQGSAEESAFRRISRVKK